MEILPPTSQDDENIVTSFSPNTSNIMFNLHAVYPIVPIKDLIGILSNPNSDQSSQSQ
jgi:hypothetical protein